jgi:hypothetical protein
VRRWPRPGTLEVGRLDGDKRRGKPRVKPIRSYEDIVV